MEFKLPELGENITSGTVTNILVKVGDTVAKNDNVLELETDKAVVEVPCSLSGTVSTILVNVGDDVQVGQAVMNFDTNEATSSPDTSSTDKNKEQIQEEKNNGNTQQSTKAEQPTPSSSPAQTMQTPKEEEPVSIDYSNYDTDVVVIGGGPGGYTAAFHAADLGLRTTLVELNPNPGGVCLYVGCIPSKALLHAAKIMNEAKEAKEIGINFNEPTFDINKLRSWKDGVVNQLTGGLGQLSKQRKVTFVQGRATFSASNLLSIEKEDGTTETLSFGRAIIATGSHPIEIPTWPHDSERMIDSTGALALKDIPQSMLVIGGGVIGLELGTVYAEFGTKVDVVEMAPNLLMGADPDLVQVLNKRLKVLFDQIMTSTKVTGITEENDGLNVAFEDSNGKATTKKYDKVMVAIGRKPNSHALGLENTHVVVDDRGFIQTNAQQLTADDSIFAIGDVIGQPMLAHKASHEGIVAAEVIAGKKAAFEPKTIPGVVYTDPEIAWCGLTESEAKEKNINVHVAKFPWGASGRALTQGRTDGLTKLIFDPDTETILGMGIVGPNAGELIAEGVLAVEMGATATDIKMSIHPHPTTSETIMESAESFFGHATHIYRPKRK